MQRKTSIRQTILVMLFVLLAIFLLACSFNLSPTNKATATVEITNAVATSAPQETPTTATSKMEINLQADGSGDYANLAEAIAAASDGATITLSSGKFTLTEPLLIDKALKLVGSGQKETEIISDQGENVVLYRGKGLFSVEEVTFRYTGSSPADVVVVESGSVDFHRCSFTGGVYDEANSENGNGLILQDVKGSITECEAIENGGNGIVLRGNSILTLENNTLIKNQWSGINYFDQSGGTAKGNDCSENVKHGIVLHGDAQPTLEQNTCGNNKGAGIAYFDSSGGTAKGNDCSSNGASGIVVMRQSNVILEDNTCNNNYDSGIAFFDNSTGQVKGNKTLDNGFYCIYVKEPANPELGDNECRQAEKEATATPTRKATPTAAQPTPASSVGPRWNPAGEPWCYNVPAAPMIDKTWQTSAPRELVMVGSKVEVGLRNKYGEKGESYDIQVLVISPDGHKFIAQTVLNADEWANLTYPDQFKDVNGQAALSLWRGVWTVTWEAVPGGYLACDGFQVGGGASDVRPDTPTPAPAATVAPKATTAPVATAVPPTATPKPVQVQPTTAPDPNQNKGCYLFQNYINAELTVTFTKKDGTWRDTFKIPANGETTYCLDPGQYTYTIDAPPPWADINGELEVHAGDRYKWPISGG